jgi:hypothetical protein
MGPGQRRSVLQTAGDLNARHGLDRGQPSQSRRGQHGRGRPRTGGGSRVDPGGPGGWDAGSGTKLEVVDGTGKTKYPRQPGLSDRASIHSTTII